MYSTVKTAKESLTLEKDLSNKKDNLIQFQLTPTLRLVGLISLLITLSVVLVFTYNNANQHFWTLFQTSIILLLVGFIALQSNYPIKKS